MKKALTFSAPKRFEKAAIHHRCNQKSFPKKGIFGFRRVFSIFHFWSLRGAKQHYHHEQTKLLILPAHKPEQH